MLTSDKDLYTTGTYVHPQEVRQMSASTSAAGAVPTDDLGLSRAEQWVLHHVMVRAIEAAHDAHEQPPWWAIGVAQKLELAVGDHPSATDWVIDSEALSCFEAWRIRRALLTYAGGEEVPESDAAVAMAIVTRLDERFEPPPSTIR